MIQTFTVIPTNIITIITQTHTTTQQFMIHIIMRYLSFHTSSSPSPQQQQRRRPTPQRFAAVVVVPFLLLQCMMWTIRIDMVEGRRLGAPTTTTTTTRTSTTRSLSSLLDTLLSFTSTNIGGDDSDLDQVHEYDTTDSNPESSSSVTTTTPPDQIIVRFDSRTESTNEPIVLTRAEIEVRAQQVATHLGGTVLQIYEHVFYGATIGNLPSATAATMTSSDDNNSSSSSTSSENDISGARTFVSDSAEVPNFSYEMNVPINGRSVSTIYDEVLNSNIHVQSDAPVSLDRINQSSLPLDQTYKYIYDGTGVTVFVVDTGIRTTHVDLQQTSIICGYSAFPMENVDGRVDGECDDANGHGTHVAGTIASQTYGVAKGATLVTVKVLDRNGGGSYSTLLGGIEYMIQYRTMYPTIPMVANLSLGSSYSTAINDAVDAAIRNNIVMVVAAGNDNTNACTTSPASTAAAITVGASRSTIPKSRLLSFFTQFIPFRRQERRTDYSNYGSCVDIFAWGSNVISLGISSTTDVVSKSGTSMATPHVTGAVALLLHRDPSLSPAAVEMSLITDASTSQLQRWYQKKSPNRTLNTQNII